MSYTPVLNFDPSGLKKRKYVVNPEHPSWENEELDEDHKSFLKNPVYKDIIPDVLKKEALHAIHPKHMPSLQELALQRTIWAKHRTQMANRRTYLAYLRTLLAIGASIHKLNRNTDVEYGLAIFILCTCVAELILNNLATSGHHFGEVIDTIIRYFIDYYPIVAIFFVLAVLNNT